MKSQRVERVSRGVHAERNPDALNTTRRRRDRRRMDAVIFAALSIPTVAVGQPGGPPPIVIQNARIMTMVGSDSTAVVENGSIIIRGDRIERVGRLTNVPARARVIDATGMTVTPGFIDADGSLTMDSGGQGDATNLAADGFDGYAERDIIEALAQGVTAVVVSPRGGTGIGGLSQVVRLTAPDATPWRGAAMQDGQALYIDLGSSTATIRRAQTVDQVRRQFKAAIDWREANETYKEELAEYEKKVKERAEKAESTTPSGGGATQPAGRSSSAQQGGQPPASGASAEIKKPTEPARNPTAEVLLRALDRELLVRIEAHRAGDILSAIALAEEFNLAMFITGSAEAHAVADAVAKSKATVILSPVLGASSWLTSTPLSPAQKRQALDNASITVVFGSGADPAATKFLLMSAQAAVAGDEAIRAVTSHVADALGVSQRIGSIEQGKLADFVIWSGDPLDPASRVEQTWVGGQPAYARPKPEAP